jgi:hypothetical protein
MRSFFSNFVCPEIDTPSKHIRSQTKDFGGNEVGEEKQDWLKS